MQSATRIILCLVIFSVVILGVWANLKPQSSYEEIAVTPKLKERFAILYRGIFGDDGVGSDILVQSPEDKDSALIDLFIPLYVAKASEVEGGEYSLKNENAKLPSVSAQSFLVADIETGDIILARSPNKVSPTASVVKLMTSLVSFNEIDRDAEVVVDGASLKTEGQAGGLVSGEKIPVSELLYPLLIVSSNDAAELLARNYGREGFLLKMSEEAKMIGMKDSNFDDPSGLSYKTVSTAHDLFKLLKYLSAERSYLVDLSKLRMRKSEGGSRSHTWLNSNPFVRRGYEYYAGGKHGYTWKAGHTLASIFSLPVSTFGERKVAIVLLKSRDLQADVKAITKYLIDNVEFN
ncbi:MAG TPA: serine hydrolase [Candidatus Paceibacterota bacterium]